MRTTEQPWALILAAGDGTRLSALSTNSSGHVPKQFCSFCDDRSLLARTVERAARIVARERILVVVAAQHRKFWEPELADLPAGNILVQPRNRGTASGLLLGCMAVMQRDPGATLVILPSDHVVDDELELRDGILRALSTATRRRHELVVLGMTPEEPDAEYGWIVPAASSDGVTTGVSAFVEKPTPARALQLMEQGALWSSFILVARLEALLRLYDSAQPRLLDAFLGTVRRFSEARWPQRLRDLYERLPTCDFSRDVLQRRTACLRMMRMPMIGWSDLGTPGRLQRCLVRMGRRTAAVMPRCDLPAAAPSTRVTVALEHALLETVVT